MVANPIWVLFSIVQQHKETSVQSYLSRDTMKILVPRTKMAGQPCILGAAEVFARHNGDGERTPRYLLLTEPSCMNVRDCEGRTALAIAAPGFPRVGEQLLQQLAVTSTLRTTLVAPYQNTSFDTHSTPNPHSPWKATQDQV